MPNKAFNSGSGANPRESSHGTIAIICGVWFCLTGWIWTNFANVLFAYPIGLLGFCAWLKAYQANPQDKRNSIAITLLGLGLASSITAAFIYK